MNRIEISNIIPQPYRDQLIDISKVATKDEDELTERAAAIDIVVSECKLAYPELFKPVVTRVQRNRKAGL